jgi:hypothetical protein
MIKTNSKHVLTAILLFCFLIVITFSCSENAADETPQLLTSAVSTNASGDASTITTSEAKEKIQSIGKKIPNETAKRWIENHDKRNPDGIKYYLFGKDAFERLLNQPNAVGIRLCNAYDDSGKPVILVVAVDEKNSLLDSADGESFLDMSRPCPPFCDDDTTN